jgi:uncharacterized protein (TIGR00255 family)
LPLISMTGFADSQGAIDTMRWRWEAKSVNGRGFDLRLRLPLGLEGIEQAARVLAGERFRRGNIQATLIFEPQEGARALKVDPAALAAAVRIAKEVAAETGLAPARIDGLLALKGVLVQDEALAIETPARAARDAAILESLSLAFDALTRARAGEGAKLEATLAGLLDTIERLTREAASVAATIPALLRDKLLSQVNDLMASKDFPHERIVQEVALLAAKADVREELDRLAAHAQEARALIGSSESVGRRLDFLAQELNREANTLCSKSADIQLTRIGLSLKAGIDQFREQAQNVE